MSRKQTFNRLMAAQEAIRLWYRSNPGNNTCPEYLDENLMKAVEEHHESVQSETKDWLGRKK